MLSWNMILTEEMFMRCSCKNCGVYMIQSEDSHLGCVCPECGNRCTACLGTNSVMDREAVRALKGNPLLADAMLNRIMEPEFEDEEQD